AGRAARWDHGFRRTLRDPRGARSTALRAGRQSPAGFRRKRPVFPLLQVRSPLDTGRQPSCRGSRRPGASPTGIDPRWGYCGMSAIAFKNTDTRSPGVERRSNRLATLRSAAFALVLLIGAAARLAYVARPMDDRTLAPWREADYVQIARNFY